MKNSKLIAIVFALVLMIMSFSTVFAQDEALPAYMISDIVVDKSITIISKNFPADSEYVISMADADDPANYIDLARFDTKEGGSFILTVDIPEALKGVKTINLLLTGPDGSTIPSSFVNAEEEAVEEPKAEETADEPVAEEPAAEETADEPVAEEPAAEETVEEPVAEEPAAEETVEKPVAEETAAEETTEEPVADEPSAEATKIDVNMGHGPVVPETETVAEETTVEEPPVVETEVYEGVPTIGIKNVIADESVDIHGENFPKRKTFKIAMSDFNSYSGVGFEVMSHDMGEDDTFNLNVPIPEELKGVSPIAINVYSDDGFYANDWFYNGDYAETADLAAEYDTSFVPTDPYATCNFNIIPSFSIDGVTKGSDVTITTKDFPADSVFKVMMGNYIAVSNAAAQPPRRPISWEEEDYIKPVYATGRPGMQPIYRPCDSPWFDGRGGRGFDNWFSKPQEQKNNTVFSGVEVGTYETGDGSSQTLTFEIPEEQKANSPIVIWIQDQSPCGFYAYNYFWNVTTGETTLPEITTEAADSEADVEADSEVSLVNTAE